MKIPSSDVYKLIHELMCSGGVENMYEGSNKSPVRFQIGIVSIYLCNRDSHGNNIAIVTLRPKWYKKKRILYYRDNIYDDGEDFKVDINYWNLLNDLPPLLAQECGNRKKIIDDEKKNVLKTMERSHRLRDVLDGTK